MKHSPFSTAARSGLAGIALAASAFTAHASPPQVGILAPYNGQTLTGVMSGASGCAVNATSSVGIRNVTLSIGSTQLASGTGSPWFCTMDTRQVPNGVWTLRVDAVDNAGLTATQSVLVRVSNPTSGAAPVPPSAAPASPPPPPAAAAGAIAPADIVGQAREDVPFAQQRGYTAQILGKHPAANAIPESGIHGPRLPNGETLRLGKDVDPTNSALKALAFQLHPGDPSTSGSKRAEISFQKNIEHNRTYWVAYRVFLRDWGTLTANDVSIFGTQLHSGDNSRGLSPSFSIVANNNGRSFQVYTVTSTSSSPSQSNSVTTRHASRSIPFGRWVDFVFQFRQNTKGNGFLRVWMDGQQIVNHTGNLGFNTPGHKDYMKFGYYNWSKGFNSPRKVLLRKPTIVLDPTGSKYTEAMLRSYVQQ